MTATLVLIADPFRPEERVEFEVEPGRRVVDALVDHWPETWPEATRLTVADGTGPSVDLARPISRGDRLVAFPELGEPISIGAIIATSLGLTGAVATIVATIVNFALVFAVQYGLTRALAPSQPRIEQANRGGFRFQGPSTNYEEGAPKPVVYGETAVGGHVLSYVADTKGKDGRLFLLLALSHGPVHSIGGSTTELDGATGDDIPDGIWINGNRANSWGGIKVWTRFGGVNQRTISGLNDLNRQVLVQQRIPGPARTARGVEFTPTDAADPSALPPPGDNNTVVYRTRTSVDRVALIFTYVRGLYRTTTRGVKTNYAVYRYRYRKDEPGSEPTPWERVRDVAKAAGVIDRREEIEFPERARYVIELQRLNYVDDTNEEKSLSILSTVIETQERDFEYPGLAVIGFEIRAREGLDGSRPDVLVEMKGRIVRVWDGVSTSSPTYVEQYSANPAWCTLDWLTNTEYGVGRLLPFATPPLTSLKSLADAADGLVPTGLSTSLLTGVGSGGFVDLASITGFTVGSLIRIAADTANEEDHVIAELLTAHRVRLVGTIANSHDSGVTVQEVHERYRCDVSLGEDRSQWEDLGVLLESARARIGVAGQSLVVIRAESKSPVAVWGEGEYVAGSFRYRYVSPRVQPTVLTGQYLNRVAGWVPDTEAATADDAVLDDASTSSYFEREGWMPDDVRLESINRPAHVLRHLGWRLRELRLRKREVACVVTLGQMGRQLGEVVRMHFPTIVDGVSGRTSAAISSGASTIKLDRAVTIDGSSTYRVHLEDDAGNVQSKDITTGAGTYAAGTALSISGTWPADVASKANYIFGVSGDELIDVEITSWMMREDRMIEVVGLEYVEAVNAD